MPRLTLTGTNIDAPDANALADFYRRLLGGSASIPRAIPSACTWDR
jgi:hypothetical protein